MSVTGREIDSAITRNKTEVSDLNGRALAEDHLRAGRTVTETQQVRQQELTIDRSQHRRDIALTQREQLSLRTQNEQLDQFQQQEASTKKKIEELRQVIQRSEQELSNQYANLSELKGTWKIWRHLGSEKDSINLAISREKEFLEAQRIRLAEFEKNQAEFAKLKQQLLSVGSEEGLTQTEKDNRRGLLVKQLEAQSQTLNNLSSVDLLALKRYQDRLLNDRPRNVWEKFSDNTQKAFEESKLGRFAIAAVTISGKVLEIAGNGISGAYNFLTDVENWKGLGRAINKLCTKISDVIEDLPQGWEKLCDAASRLGRKMCTRRFWEDAGDAVCRFARKSWEFVTSPDTWDRAGKFCMNFLSATGEALQRIGERALELLKDPRKIGDMIVALGVNSYELTKTVLHSACLLFVDPDKAWETLCSGVDRAAKNFCKEIGIPPNIWNACKSVLEAVKSLSDSMGLTEIVSGLCSIISLPGKAIKNFGSLAIDTFKAVVDFTQGKITADQLANSFAKSFSDCRSNMIEAVKGVGDVFVGAYRLAVEFTGLADIARGLVCAARGNWAQAGFYLGVGITSLVGCVIAIGTAGAGAYLTGLAQAAKKTTTRMGMECFKMVGKSLGTSIAKEVTEKIGMQTLKDVAVKVADNLVEHCAKEGLSLITIEAASKKLAKDSFKEAMEKELTKIVEKQVTKALQEIIDNPSKKALLKILDNAPGLDLLTTRHITSAKRLLGSGKHIDNIVKELTTEITDGITARICPELEEVFAKRLSESLAGKVSTPAARNVAEQLKREALEKGISEKELIEQYVTKARKGFREGFKDAVSEIVEKAVRNAIKKLRYNDNDLDFLISEEIQSRASKSVATGLSAVYAAVAGEKEKPAQVKAEKAVEKEKPAKRIVKTEKVDLGSQIMERTLELLNESQEWKVVGTSIEAKPQDVNSKAAKAVEDGVVLKQERAEQQNKRDKAA